jgi:hypothetical protein
MPHDPTSPAEVAPWSERLCALVVTALPAGAALSRLSHQPTWREDVVVLRDVALVGVGPGGGVSTALAQVTGALPLGTTSFRAALVATVALGVAARLGYAIALRLLRAAADARPMRGAIAGGAGGTAAKGAAGATRATTAEAAWLAPTFAAIAVCGAALSPTVQLEATVAGGATVAAALVLGAITLAARAVDPGREAARGRDVAGALVLVGGALAERPLAAAAALVGVLALLFTHRLVARAVERVGAGVAAAARLGRDVVRAAREVLGRPEPAARGDAAGARRSAAEARRPRRALVPARALALGGVLAAVAAIIATLPALVRPIAPLRALDLGLAALPIDREAVVTTTALAAWRSELGWTPLALAALGLVVLAARASSRPGAAALATLVAIDALAPVPLGGRAVTDPGAALRTLAVLALAVLAAIGLHDGVARLLRARVPYARPAAILLVAFQATLAALASEQASYVADRAAQRGAEEWLDASRAALEARAVALARAPAKATRLWAAQLTGGFRPDVVVAASELLPRPGVATDLMAREPRSRALVRATALRGAPDEFSLSELADARPLHVEPDRGWDPRTASHVELDGMWVRFASHPIGRTDRKRSAAESMAPLARVLAAVDPVEPPDPATSAVVAATVREQALVLAQLGESETARALAIASRHLGPTTSVGSPAAAVLLASLELTRPDDAPVPVKRTSKK